MKTRTKFDWGWDFCRIVPGGRTAELPGVDPVLRLPCRGLWAGLATASSYVSTIHCCHPAIELVVAYIGVETGSLLRSLSCMF